jgi:hypothetical protein
MLQGTRPAVRALRLLHSQRKDNGMDSKSAIAVAAALFLIAGCGEESSTAGGGKGDGLVPNSGIEPSPGVKGPGKVDSSGGGEAGTGPGGAGGTNMDHKSGDTLSGGKKNPPR